MYRFKEEFRDSVVSIPQLRLNITRFNISDEYVQKLLKKFPGRYDHNFEWVEEDAVQPVVEEPLPPVIEQEEEKPSKKPKPQGKSNKGGKSKKSKN